MQQVALFFQNKPSCPLPVIRAAVLILFAYKKKNFFRVFLGIRPSWCHWVERLQLYGRGSGHSPFQDANESNNNDSTFPQNKEDDWQCDKQEVAHSVCPFKLCYNSPNSEGETYSRSPTMFTVCHADAVLVIHLLVSLFASLLCFKHFIFHPYLCTVWLHCMHSGAFMCPSVNWMELYVTGLEWPDLV